MNILLQFILGALFLSIFFISVTLPALALIRKLFRMEDELEIYTIASVLGIVIFTIVAYILAALHLRYLMWVFPITGIILLFKYKINLNKVIDLKHKKFFLLVIMLGIIGQVAVNAPSGFPYKDGIYFWSSHGHDGIWHLALMEHMKNGDFPFLNPELAGQKLQNYHFFVDLLMSEFSRLFMFSNLDIYFRFMPIIFSVLLGFGSFIFVKLWSKSEVAGIWAMFFTYFAGSFGYLIYVPTHKSLGGESIFWVSQTHSVLGNPPHAAAFIITTFFLFTYLKFLRNRSLNYFIISAFLGGAVIGFKVYAGVLLLGGLLLVGILEFLTRRIYKGILLFITTLAISGIIYLPNSVNSQDFLIWQPWWYIRTMVVASDRLNWLDLELRRQTYIAENNWKRVIQVELMAFLIFLFGNLGMRFLGFWTILKKLRQNIFKDSFNLFFLSITLASFFIPIFFLQKGVAWNSIQFNQYFLLFFGFWAGASMANIMNVFKNDFVKTCIVVLVIILSVPTQLGLLWQFYSNPALSKISLKEIEALNYLKNQPDGIVLVAPFNKYEKDKYKNPPIPIYAWYDTGYVSAFSSKKTLISDEEQINIMGYDVSKLVKMRKEAFESLDKRVVNNFLAKYDVRYIYLSWDQKFATSSAYINADIIYENSDAKILKVK